MGSRDRCFNESRTTLNEVNVFREELVAFVEKGDTRESIIVLSDSTETGLVAFIDRAAQLLHRINLLLNNSSECDATVQGTTFPSGAPAWELRVQHEWLSELVKQMDNMIAV